VAGGTQLLPIGPACIRLESDSNSKSTTSLGHDQFSFDGMRQKAIICENVKKVRRRTKSDFKRCHHSIDSLSSIELKQLTRSRFSKSNYLALYRGGALYFWIHTSYLYTGTQKTCSHECTGKTTWVLLLHGKIKFRMHQAFKVD
jgi:hypothetical protein